MAGPFDNLTFGFNANDPVSPEGMALRQRIAMQMMGQGGRKGYPKNAGEGLTAIGDSLGDIGMANRLERQMAGLEARSAARAPLPATLPPAAAPRGTDPSVRSDAGDATPTVNLADAAGMLTDVAGGADSVSPSVQTADVAPTAAGPANAVQANQLATLLGTGGGDQTPSYAPTASTDANAPVVEQAPPGNISPAAAQVRSRIASNYPQAVTAPGVQQPNPMLGAVPAALSASTAPMVPPPEQAGSPDEAADNRPIVLAQNTSPNYPGGTKRGTSDFPNREVYIKPPSAESEPVPAPEAQKRYQTPEQFTKPGVFSTPPRIENPGQEELSLMRAATDPTVLPSYQAQYKERALELAQKRKDDYDQAVKAWTAKDQMIQTERAAEQTRMRDAARIESEQQEREQKKQAADYKEQIIRHLGGRDPGKIEENLYKSKASISNIPAIMQSIQRARNVQDKMYHGPLADTETYLSQIMPSFVGFDPARGAATQQFKTAMTNVATAARAAVVGPGAQSDKEFAALQKATAADAKLDKDTIREALDAAEKLMAKTAIAHQKEVHDYAGNFDPDRVRSVFGSFGVPGMEDVVPRPSIKKLMDNAGDKNVLRDFDETYHTPGLAARLIQREMQRRGAR